MKTKIDSIIVVEGKSDIAYLSNYFDAEFVSTNGSDVPASVIEYLKKVSECKKIIVLTDPDTPGKRIRQILDNEIPNLTHCYINKEYAIKKNKVGVAECDIDEIVRALNNEFSNVKQTNNTITSLDMFELGLEGTNNSKQLREKLSKSLSLGHNNAKSLLKKLNILQLNKEDIRKIIYE